MERAKKVTIEVTSGPFHNEYLVYPADSKSPEASEQEPGKNRFPSRLDALAVANDMLLTEDEILPSTNPNQELAEAAG